MRTSMNEVIKYEIISKDQKIELNQFIGKKISIKYSGKIFCLNCSKPTKKSYAQGHCFPCSIKLAECDMCILRPETCHYYQGTCREPSWGEEHCLKPHVVYLANSSGLKVGITRKTQVPFRWIDQGATSALPVLEVKDRLTSGKIEVLCKNFFPDKTDWRKMLKGQNETIDLKLHKEKLLQSLSEELKSFDCSVLNDEVINFNYPVLNYPEKINSLTLDKIPSIESELVGIKGQYLILNQGVFNVRNHSGYEVEFLGA